MAPQPRVLYVDDDQESRELLPILLKLWRIETTAVGTAAQGLSLIQSERFDLYLLDAWLPDLDGVELCRRMRSFDAHTPIIFFSGATLDIEKQRGIDAGANAYVVKPDVDGLIKNITQFISCAETALA